MVALKSQQGTLGSTAPTPYQKGRVLSVDLIANLAEVQFADRRSKVSLAIRQAKGGLPAVGEVWLLNQNYGNWSFAALLGPAQPGEWLVPTLLPGWTALTANAPAYQLDAAGVVRWRGGVTGSSYTVSSVDGPLPADILQAPAGYRPGAVFGPVAASSNHAYGELLVLPTGYLRAQVGASWISLAGLSYPAEQ